MRGLKLKFECLLIVFAVLALAGEGWASTVAYWRFEGPAPNEPNVFCVENPYPAMPDINGITGWNSGLWRKAAHDWSGNGNHLTTWDYSWAGWEWDSNVPATTVPATGFSNALSMKHTQAMGPYPACMTWSSQSNPGGTDIETITPAQFTVEASFMMTATEDYRTIVGRDGMNVWTGNPQWAPLYFSVRPGNPVAIEFTDVCGYNHTAQSAPGIVGPNTWYHMVGVSDGNTLSLYLEDVNAGTGMRLVAQTDLTASGSPDTSLTNAAGSSGTDWTGGAWSVGRGLWDANHTDRWFGYIDEVRISDTALGISEFLWAPPTAFDPSPADGAPNVSTTATLSWSAGCGAASHDVYFGTNSDDVNDANRNDPEYQGTVVDPCYPLIGLDQCNTYYWRIHEVNDACVPFMWGGEVWSFKTSCTGDFDDDCRVDYTDLGIMTDDWLDSNNVQANLNDDDGLGIVNFKDFASLVNNWLEYCMPDNGIADYDEDGLSNWDELTIYGTDPRNPDTDGDLKKDGEEVNAWNISGTVLTEFSSFTNLIGEDANTGNMVFADPCIDGYVGILNVPISNKGVEIVTDVHMKLTGEEFYGHFPQPHIIVGTDERTVFPDWDFDRAGETYLEEDTHITLMSLISWGIQKYIEEYIRDNVIPGEGLEIEVPLYIYSNSQGRLAISDIEIQTSIVETNPLRADDHLVFGKIEGVYDQNDADGLARPPDYQDLYGFREPIKGDITISNIETGDAITTTANADGFYIFNMADLPPAEPNQWYNFSFDGMCTDPNLSQYDIVFDHSFLKEGYWFTHMVQLKDITYSLEKKDMYYDGLIVEGPSTYTYDTTAPTVLNYAICSGGNLLSQDEISDWTTSGTTIKTSNQFTTRYLRIKTRLEMEDSYTGPGTFWCTWYITDAQSEDYFMGFSNYISSKNYDPPATLNENTTDYYGNKMIPWVKVQLPKPSDLGYTNPLQDEGKIVNVHFTGDTVFKVDCHVYESCDIEGKTDDWRLTVPLTLTFTD